ncbi:hypothetical protein V9K67_26940 [Paraflavisolibacter sp. H34]|uniref:hypothetical protein n=1 Tax=Huijunlia imazamoxiresistens TaxID=3127457 RepID=UPI00301AF461
MDDKLDNYISTEQKIKRYHSEEIMLILFICSADLSDYKKEDLVNFSEAIEGRIEVLFEPSFLLGLSDHLEITPEVLEDFQRLRELLISFYSSSWHKKMQEKAIWGKVSDLSSGLLKRLNIDWVEPNKFIDNHLEVDWT